MNDGQFLENLETMGGALVGPEQLATIGACLEKASIRSLIGLRKLAVCNHLGTTPARILQRIGSGDCRDIRTISAILAVHGLGLAIVDADSLPIVRYAPFPLASAEALAEYRKIEGVRDVRKKKEAGGCSAE